MDVDLFKHYNDRFGHQAGDDCLIAVCDAAQKHLRRHGDFLSRYGGEEFAVVLPNTQAFAAAELAERIREEIAGLHLYPGAAAEPAMITISIGVATGNPESDVDEHALLETADVALYDAKKAGRNRVVVGGSDVRATVLRH
jgi:diguanylate cyclase (GGDEF)-like protein